MYYFFFSFSIKNELSEIQEKANISGGRYKQNQRFEEMRVLQGMLILFIHLVFIIQNNSYIDRILPSCTVKIGPAFVSRKIGGMWFYFVLQIQAERGLSSFENGLYKYILNQENHRHIHILNFSLKLRPKLILNPKIQGLHMEFPKSCLPAKLVLHVHIL